MNPSLPQLASRLAAIALLIVILVAVYLFVINPVVAAYRTADEEIEQARELLERYQVMALNKSVLRQRLNEVYARQSDTGVYLTGATDALAAAELQTRVRQGVVEFGGQLRSTQNLPAKVDRDFRRVAVRVQLTANLSSLHHLLFRLESEKPFVFVDSLDVRNRRGTRRQALENFDPQLTIRFDLFGYLNPEAEE